MIVKRAKPLTVLSTSLAVSLRRPDGPPGLDLCSARSRFMHKCVHNVVGDRRTGVRLGLSVKAPQCGSNGPVLCQRQVKNHKAELQSISFFQAIIITIIIDYSYNYSQSPVIIARPKFKFQPPPQTH